jgi:hypothetical protein
MPPTLNRVAESAIEAGRVNTQARPILRTVSPWMLERLAHMVPATWEERTWVVLTGMRATSASPIVTPATNFGGGALGVGQVFLADLLSHRHHDPLVSERRAHP